MDKYVKAQDVVNAAYILNPENKDGDGSTPILLPRKLDSYEVENIVLSLPAADVEPVTYGEWIEDDYGYNRCSECGYEFDRPWDKTPRCPGCGAHMDDEEDGEK